MLPRLLLHECPGCGKQWREPDDDSVDFVKCPFCERILWLTECDTPLEVEAKE